MAYITADDMLEGLRKAVAREGTDFVYETPDADGDCVYLDDAGRPSCLVARALDVLGVENWREWPGIERNTDAGSLDRYGALTPEAASVAFAAQQVQDYFRPWGEALDAAEAEYARVAA